MTAEILDFSNFVGFRWNTSNGTQQVSYQSKSEPDLPTPTLGKERSYRMRSEIIFRLLELARRSPNVQRYALARVVEWMLGLPEVLPNPFVAIGDDGSISTEWDVAGNSLHITFDKDAEEVYFFSPDGEEWESSLDAIDKVSAAMRTIALAFSARR
jgi:hypothetical protein